jgi:predicted molibdopterin-dependent oxidoreductase YjgC
VVANAIQRAKNNKETKLIVIDSSLNPLPLYTDLWLKPNRNSEEVLIAGLGRIHLLNDLLTLGKEDTVDVIRYMSRSEKNEISRITKIDVETLERAAEMYGRARQAVIICGEGLLKSGGSNIVSSILKLASVTNNVCGDSLNVISLKTGANSRGAWQMGLAAKPINWDEVQSLYLFLGDDDIKEELLKQIRGLDFLIVQASYQSPVTEMADIVLPSPTWAERVGTYISMDGQSFESAYLLKRRDDIKGDTLTINTISQKLDRVKVKSRR